MKNIPETFNWGIALFKGIKTGVIPGGMVALGSSFNGMSKEDMYLSIAAVIGGFLFGAWKNWNKNKNKGKE